MKKTTKKIIIKLTIFTTLVNLPFLTIAQLFGLTTFIDTFTNPSYYTYYKTNEIGIEKPRTTFLIIQKKTHPDFSILSGDTIFYLKAEGGLTFKTVNHIYTQKYGNHYSVVSFTEGTPEETVTSSQILGKVLTAPDDTIWNSFSLKIWDISKTNLNAVALFIYS